ncbi:hypothetical protein Cantr_01153 [Candida viswanathii]|uniref:Uncharacterized protein n=1 Tax=Candida viswanathii TaxID=5486 RepID=A0A367YIJ0_9ASCO|nr:hypothetical protein Cantr_01153 [Candida viswanathii]
MSHNYDGSSSSDDETGKGPQHPMFHVQLPTNRLNLEEVRRQNHMKHEKPTIVKTTASNFAKAKKITTGTNKNFGRTPGPSSSKSTNPEFRKSFIPLRQSADGSDSDSDDDLDEEDEFKINPDEDKRMKNFTFNSAKPLPFDDNQHYYNDDEDGDESDELEDETNVDFSNINQNPPQQFYQTDSSDESDGEEEAQNKSKSEEEERQQLAPQSTIARSLMEKTARTQYIQKKEIKYLL